MPTTTILLLGGNIGDTVNYFRKATQMLTESGCRIGRTSALYGSKAWGFRADNDFINQVIGVETEQEPEILLDTIQQIEKLLGRVKTRSGYESRVIDIDILFHQSEIIHTQRLTVPHPRLHLRKFTLMPLSEIWPHMLHPTLEQTAEQLLQNCTDKTETWKIG